MEARLAMWSRMEQSHKCSSAGSISDTVHFRICFTIICMFQWQIPQKICRWTSKKTTETFHCPPRNSYCLHEPRKVTACNNSLFQEVECAWITVVGITLLQTTLIIRYGSWSFSGLYFQEVDHQHRNQPQGFFILNSVSEIFLAKQCTVDK